MLTCIASPGRQNEWHLPLAYSGDINCELFAACAGNFAGMNQMLFRKEA
ncbi:hypothetical protein [uncultured Desulfobulbus sp.]